MMSFEAAPERKRSGGRRVGVWESFWGEYGYGRDGGGNGEKSVGSDSYAASESSRDSEGQGRGTRLGHRHQHHTIVVTPTVYHTYYGDDATVTLEKERKCR